MSIVPVPLGPSIVPSGPCLSLPSTYYAKDMVTFGAPHRGLGHVADGLCDLGWLPAGLLAAFAIGRRLDRTALFLGVVVLMALGAEEALRATRGEPWISRLAVVSVLAGSIGYT